MTTMRETESVKIERTIPAAAAEVFDAWLDPKIPGTPWHENEKLIMDARIDGLWYWLSRGSAPHYGRFIEIARPGRIRHTWVSPNTLGVESIVTVTFEKKGDGTLMTLEHSGLPNAAMAKAHEQGWNAIVDRFAGGYGG